MYFSGYSVTILYVGSGKSKKSINTRGQKRDTGPCVLFFVLFLLPCSGSKTHTCSEKIGYSASASSILGFITKASK